MTSRIGFGIVRHRRFAPVKNAFAYRVALLYLDLAEVPALFRWPGLLALERFGLYAFRRKDYLGDPARPCPATATQRHGCPFHVVLASWLSMCAIKLGRDPTFRAARSCAAVGPE